MRLVKLQGPDHRTGFRGWKGNSRIPSQELADPDEILLDPLVASVPPLFLASSQPKSNLGLIIGYVVAGLVVLGVIVVGIYVFFTSEKGSNIQDQTAQQPLH
ncbi:hypothetical protein Chor_011689, partial [Crotalus horridus]